MSESHSRRERSRNDNQVYYDEKKSYHNGIKKFSKDKPSAEQLPEQKKGYEKIIKRTYIKIVVNNADNQE